MNILIICSFFCLGEWIMKEREENNENLEKIKTRKIKELMYLEEKVANQS